MASRRFGGQSRSSSQYLSHGGYFPVMVQLPLAGFEGATHLHVVDDLGCVQQTASAPHYVRADNGQEYIAKGPLYTPGQPYVVVNEWVAAKLAEALGLPVLDSRILDLNGDILFGSSWMMADSFYPDINQDRFNRCENRDRVYGLVAFDAWVCNSDRHSQNLVVRCIGSKGSGERLLMLLNDHSHCLIPPGDTPAGLGARMSLPVSSSVMLPFVRDAITDPSRLGDSLAKIEGLSSEYILTVVRTVPRAFLLPNEREAIVQFLLDRRARLRQLFEQERGHFPNLGGGPL